MKEKTNQLLIYITQNYQPITVTTLMKLSYLIDLTSMTRGKEQISDFIYRRYKFGPFDKSIYNYLNNLVIKGILTEETEFTPTVEEYIKYIPNKDYAGDEIRFNRLKEDEVKIIDEVISELRGCGAKALTLITYKTKPMKALKATFGGTENLNAVIDLKSK